MYGVQLGVDVAVSGETVIRRALAKDADAVLEFVRSRVGRESRNGALYI